ncbi:threonine aldolase family protein [Streptococcus sp. DD12]|uniref:threonine aldolase family protein n=1 Tax=Streptococcus sp. DD12 TaxID=1777880 RepID=UPI0007987FDB|nr:aminotransferase class I/II-fold pyridoxal phosphate-dependent enzyme [Streptococcus sp. DD12]KXT77017.1 Low-specificity L-threonine aldolase [Streptococcus sp. DD12]
MTTSKPNFSNDYLQACHPAILDRMVATNTLETTGYGSDPITASAVEKIRQACQAPQADVRFLIGGTQTNQVVIDALLRPYQGVVAAKSGHISVHEAGAIEFGGHKVMALDSPDGKLSAQQVQAVIADYWNDANHEHMVMPGMVYISQPTELGTLYSKAELEAISAICRKNDVILYVDGARLAYALAAPENDVTLADLAQLCDAFYIGGTKCGAMFGEAIVLPDPKRIPHFTSIIKQHGALLAKGRLLGIQFDTLFSNDLYLSIGERAIAQANRMRQALKQAGYQLVDENPTNQIFCVVTKDQMAQLAKDIDFSFWESYDDSHTIIRFVTCWSTQDSEVERFCRIITEEAKATD